MGYGGYFSLFSLSILSCASSYSTAQESTELPSVTEKPMVVRSGEVFACTPTQVWDGDGPIWCAEGPRVRLSGINALEMDEPSCKPGYPCVKQVTGPEARDALVALLGVPMGPMSSNGHVLVQGPTLECTSAGSARGVRTAAFCISPVHGDLSCAMVEGGWAAVWPKYWGKQIASREWKRTVNLAFPQEPRSGTSRQYGGVRCECQAQSL